MAIDADVRLGRKNEGVSLLVLNIGGALVVRRDRPTRDFVALKNASEPF